MITFFSRHAKADEVLTYETSSFLPLRERLRVSFSEARVDQTIMPGEVGRVAFDGTVWNALSVEKVKVDVGQKVRVIGLKTATTLLVSPL